MHHPNQNYYYAILLLIATLSYATNVNLIKKYLSDLSPLSISVGNFTVMLLPATIILLSSGFIDVIHDVKVQNSILYIMILGIIGTGIANIIFFRLIQTATPIVATSVTYLIPVVAFFWGLLDHEFLTVVQLIGASIVLIGVYLTSKK
jgi:drug/metabolite transporter (DMT)-like permease